LGLLLDRVDVALELAALVARGLELLLECGLLAAQRLQRRRLVAGAEAGDLGAQLLDGAFGRLLALAELVVLVIALGEQLALRCEPALEIGDAAGQHLGLLDLQDELAVEVGDTLAQILDATTRVPELARSGLGVRTLLRQPSLRRGKLLFGITDPILQ